MINLQQNSAKKCFFLKFAPKRWSKGFSGNKTLDQRFSANFKKNYFFLLNFASNFFLFCVCSAFKHKKCWNIQQLLIVMNRPEKFRLNWGLFTGCLETGNIQILDFYLSGSWMDGEVWKPGWGHSNTRKCCPIYVTVWSDKTSRMPNELSNI